MRMSEAVMRSRHAVPAEWSEKRMAGLGQRLDDWFDGPASWLAERAGARRSVRPLAARLHADGTLHLTATRGSAAMIIPKADNAPQPVVAAARKRIEGRTVSLALPDDAIIRRTLTLPAEAAEHLQGIIAARLAALSPLPAESVDTGHRVLSTAQDGKIEVEVLIAPKARTAEAMTVLTRLGASALLLTGGERDVVLSSPGATAQPRQTGRKAIKFGLKVTTLLSVLALGAVVAGGPAVMASLELEGESFALRAEAAKAKIAALAGRTKALGTNEEQALALKDQAVSLALALDDLAAAMPDTAHALEVAFANGVFTISGRASDVPQLVTALEESGRFSQTALLGQSSDEEEGETGQTAFSLATRPSALSGVMQQAARAPTGTDEARGTQVQQDAEPAQAGEASGASAPPDDSDVEGSSQP
jgi:general secretion pathway protein L